MSQAAKKKKKTLYGVLWLCKNVFVQKKMQFFYKQQQLHNVKFSKNGSKSAKDVL